MWMILFFLVPTNKPLKLKSKALELALLNIDTNLDYYMKGKLGIFLVIIEKTRKL